MKESMDAINDSARDVFLLKVQDLDKSKNKKQSENTETSVKLERHVAYEGIKPNVHPSDKLVSAMSNETSSISTAASVNKSENQLLEDTFFSTPKKCNGVPCDLEKLNADASQVTKPAIDFTAVTVADLGITPEIFTIKSSGNIDKLMLKARRRSTIGVRGSPETNFLIRYIAQQRSNTRKESSAQASPYRSPSVQSPYSSSLKDKITVFRSSFQSLDENSKKTSFSEFPEKEEESEATEIKNKSPFKKQNGSAKAKLNGEPLSKRKRLDTEGGFSLKSSEAKETESISDSPCNILEVTAGEISKGSCFDSSHGNISYSRCSFSGVTPDLLAVERGEVSLSQCGEREIVNHSASKQSGRKLLTFAEHLVPPCRPSQKAASVGPVHVKDCTFLRPVLKKTPLKEYASILDARACNVFAEGTGFLESEVTKAVLLEENEDIRNSNKKRVTFGRDLSPELFDRSLPPNTPLRKGGTPGSDIEPRTASPSPLETGINLSPFTQPNFDECIEPHVDCFENGLPSENPLSSDTTSGAVPSASTTTFEETSLANIRTTRSSSKRKCAGFMEKTDDCDPSTTKPKCTRQQKFGDKQQTRNTRSVNKNSQVTKGKTAREKRGKKKMVPKPLYGARELASKKPLLSPIVELPETSGTPSSSASWRLSQGGNLVTRDTLKEPVEEYSRNKNAVKDSSRKIIINTEGNLFDMSKDEQVPMRNEERQDVRRETSEKGVSTVEDTQTDECNPSEINSSRMSFHLPTINGIASGLKSVEMNILEQAGNMADDANSTTAQKTEECSNIKLPSEYITSDTAVVQKHHSKRGKYRRRSLRLSERHSLTVKHTSRANAREVSLHLPVLVNQSMDGFLLGSMQKTEDGLDISLMEKDTSQDAETTMGCTPNQILSASSSKVLCPKFEENGNLEDVNSCYNRDCILPLLTEASAKEKSKIQSKARRNTIFCLFPEVDISEGALASPEKHDHNLHGDRPILPMIMPSTNDSETNASDHSFCIEDVLGSVASGDRRKVRRSARLHRDSGISGLTWIETSSQSRKDIASSSLKSRRKTMSISAFKTNENSPQGWKTGKQFSMPNKENCENLPVLFSFNKPRQRRSMCALTVQDTGASKFQKNRRSYSFKNTTICKTDVDKKELLAEKQIND